MQRLSRRAAKAKGSFGEDPVHHPDNAETQPLVPGSPPRCLGEVVATLELEGVEPFPIRYGTRNSSETSLPRRSKERTSNKELQCM